MSLGHPPSKWFMPWLTYSALKVLTWSKESMLMINYHLIHSSPNISHACKSAISALNCGVVNIQILAEAPSLHTTHYIINSKSSRFSTQHFWGTGAKDLDLRKFVKDDYRMLPRDGRAQPKLGYTC